MPTGQSRLGSCYADFQLAEEGAGVFPYGNQAGCLFLSKSRRESKVLWCVDQTPSTSAKVVIWKHGRFQRRICAPSGRGWEEITTKPSKEHDPQDCTGSGTAPSPHRRFHMPRYSIFKRHMEDGFPPLGFRKIGGRLGWGCPEGETKAGGKGGEIFALVVIGGRHKKSSIEINCLNFSWNYIYSSSFILSF